MSAARPTRRRELLGRLGPFALVALLGLFLVPLPGQPYDGAAYAAGAVATLAVIGVGLLAPWHRLPAWTPVLPPLLYLAAIACLRAATGGGAGGVGPLVLLPVVWLALYGTPRQLGAVVAAVACVFALPLLLVGPPDYPAGGWRTGALLVVLAAIIGVTVQRLVSQVRAQALAARRGEEERARLLEQVSELARTDPLTGLGNRRAWDEALARVLAQADRTGTPACLAMLDLDGFKALNDDAGHQAGDRALQFSATAWRDELRSGDVIARLGGDEFGVLLVGCDLAAARVVVERLRRATVPGLGCSAGLVQWDGREDAAALQRRTDGLLYAAKRQGGDRMLVAELRLLA